MEIRQYEVAGWPYRIVFHRLDHEVDRLLASSQPFERERDDADCCFVLQVNEAFGSVAQSQAIGDFDTGGNTFSVFRTVDGGYELRLADFLGRKCARLFVDPLFREGHLALAGDEGMQPFGLNNALMMMLAFSTAERDTLLIHSSAVEVEGKGYAFLGTSGTGKSTHTGNWLRYIRGSQLLNDDNPCVRMVDGKAQIYGTPWSGKAPCYKDLQVPLEGIVQLEQAPMNEIRRLEVMDAFVSLLSSCSLMKWDDRIYRGICASAGRVIESVPLYGLRNLPNAAAVKMAFEVLTAKHE
jgi:hypothetical protein